MINKNCLNCNKLFKTYLSKIKLGRGKYCSSICVKLSFKGKHFSPGTELKIGNKLATLTKGKMAWNKGKINTWMIGSKNHNWKNGISNHNQGYLTQKSGINMRKLQHRLVMEEHLGRELTPEEIIHHINHNKLDNRIENLMLTTRKEHIKIHPPLKKLKGGVNSLSRL